MRFAINLTKNKNITIINYVGIDIFILEQAILMRSFLLLLCIFFISNVQTFAVQDLMQQAFVPSTTNQQIVNLGNTKMAVGNTVFFWSHGLSCGRVDGRLQCRQSNTPPLIVHIIKLLLRTTIVLAIPFLLFNAVWFVTAIIGWAVSDYLTYTYRILIWIAAILTSIAIIWLIQSAVVATILWELLRWLLG